MKRCCRTCRWWDEEGASLAAAIREASTERDIGTCEVNPPQVVGTLSGRALSYFPRVHADRVCGQWTALLDAPNDGERQGEVVPLKAVA